MIAKQIKLVITLWFTALICLGCDRNRSLIQWETLKDGRTKMVVRDGSSNLATFPDPVASNGLALDRGNWLIYVCATWSIEELGHVKTVSESANFLDGVVRVGVQPFYENEEVENLIPPHELEPGPGPRWLIVIDRTVVAERTGYLTSSQVVSFVRRHAKTKVTGHARAP